MYIKDNWTKFDVLVLTYFKNITFEVIEKAIHNYHSFDEALEAGFFERNLKKMNTLSIFDDDLGLFDDMAKKQLDLCQNNNIEILTFWDEDYPKLLKNIFYPPALIFVRGNKNLNDKTHVSIVGTRNNSIYGKLVTEKFVEEFVNYDLSIVSGLARGIDTHAHLNTLKNNGNTVSVIASGIDKISPQISAKLADEIVEKDGSIVSEYKCGITARQGYFPQRNRIISGMSMATLVVESDKRGGSLITARFAFEQSREVFAIPGNINSAKSQGTNKLISENIAQLALSPIDIITSLGIEEKVKESLFSANNTLNEEEKVILEFIQSVPIQIDEIFEKSGLEISVLLVKLLELEYKGLIKQLPGKFYIKSF